MDEAAAALAFWLAGMFAVPPEPARLAGWLDAEGRAVLGELAAGAGVKDEVAAVLAAAGDAVTLERSHVRLFSGVAGGQTVAPFQSVFEEGRMWGTAAVAMRARLEAAGVGPLAVLKSEPPDHIATELALLAELLQRGEGPAARALAAEQIVPWVGRFADTLAEFDAVGFYAAAGRTAAALAGRLGAGQPGGSAVCGASPV